MGFFKNQLIDIIEWLDNSPDTMAWRFPRGDNEIKNGAKLIVRESQAAAFVAGGKLADVYQPGTYTLNTPNMPLLSDLMGWKYGFESPFKAEVYFISTRTFTDRKWGTKNPIMLRDADFGIVRLRAFGTFAIRIANPANFLRQIAGTNGQFSLEELDSQLRDMVSARFADALGASKIAALDLAGNYEQLGRYILPKIETDFEPFGLQIANFYVENISLPPEVEAAIDKRSSMGAIGNLAAYTQYQTANALPAAAANPGGLAGAGASLAMGVAMGNAMQQGLQGQQTVGPAGPPPLPKKASYYVAVNGQQAGPFDMSALQDKITAGAITRESMVWTTGMPAWVAASNVAELASMFQEVPPPLPPGMPKA
ncbi:MAG TPA: SPFH domain-containing protein [Tepidisphaeraceae bacterium]|jgi:membrane protease subunit (stomatin/prohibitin family)|nr:SPFH domain-containing protein [Tepidisphaeraceae bacterium]